MDEPRNDTIVDCSNSMDSLHDNVRGDSNRVANHLRMGNSQFVKVIQ
jgi:hypothetical protein